MSLIKSLLLASIYQTVLVNSAAISSSILPSTTAPPDVTQSVYWQCGGVNYDGPTNCAPTDVCTSINEWYFQCVPSSAGIQAVTKTVDIAANPNIQSAYWQCGGENWVGSSECAAGYTCSSLNSWYYQCLPITSSADSVVATAAAVVATATSTSQPSVANNAVVQSAYWQCGGENWVGSSQCASEYSCSSLNPWYSQCLPTTTANAVANAAAVTTTLWW